VGCPLLSCDRARVTRLLERRERGIGVDSANEALQRNAGAQAIGQS
jgi:hypothetical protein